MQAGKLRRQITIQSRTAAQSGSGEVSYTWATLATVWSERIDLRAGERMMASQPTAVLDSVFVIRYRTDVDSTMRVVDGGDTFEVDAVRNPEGRNRQLELLCKKVD